jgi:ATP-dependent Clp protease ATP-binding subunit ClpA
MAALAFARKEAQRRHATAVEREDLAAALARLDDPTLVALCARLDVARANFAAPPSTAAPVRGDAIDYTPALQQTIAIAIKEAEFLGHSEPGAEHLFYALARTSGGDAHWPEAARVRDAIRALHSH